MTRKSAKQHAEKDLHLLKKLETNRDKGRLINFPRIIQGVLKDARALLTQ